MLLVGCLFSLAGCRKKAATEKPAAKVQAKAAAEKPVANVQAKADIEKPIADVQAEAEKLNVEQLRTKAMEYKDAIVAKKAELGKLTAKLKEIPLAQQLGAEAKSIQADIANVNKAIAPLTERFQVYYNKLKEKGGNLAGLEL
jgi:ABC-type transporter Mla subunit MlaD